MSSNKPQDDKPWLTPTRTTFLIGCATGAITITALLSILRKYISPSNIPNNNNTNKIIILPTKTTTTVNTNNNIPIEKKEAQNDEQFFNNKSLLNDRVYKRLQSECKPKTTFYYQQASNAQIPFVTAINILVEYLPNSVIKTVFLYLPNPKQFDVSTFLKNGWEVSNNTLHDYPNIYVENVLPIKNQPSLILTIGLPGSGKTTWAKIRTPFQKNVIAADDYFDKFHNGAFNASLLGKAHEWAQQNVHNSLKAGYTAVANNTNTTLSEMHAYVTKVVFGNLPHKIIFAVMPETNITVLCKRGVHGVPRKKIKEMFKRMNYWLEKRSPCVNAVLKAGAFRRFQASGVSKEVIYTGVFMNEKTQDTIRRYFMSMSGEVLLSDTTDCHLTLKYLPLYNEVDKLPFGKKVCLRIVGYAVHKYINCFIVDIMDDDVRRLCTNKHPHISLSFNKAHVRPNYSNALLLNGKIVPVINNFDVLNTVNYDSLYRTGVIEVNGGGLVVEGTVGAFYKNPNGGVFLGRRQKSEKKEQLSEQGYDGSGKNVKNKNMNGKNMYTTKKKRRRGGRNKNKNKNKNKNDSIDEQNKNDNTNANNSNND